MTPALLALSPTARFPVPLLQLVYMNVLAWIACFAIWQVGTRLLGAG